MQEQILTFEKSVTSIKRIMSTSERTTYLKKYGRHTQSFAAFQPGMEYFDMPGIGFISYMRKLGMVFVLSDPVTAPENFETILDCFHNRFRNASYIQVSKEVADILNEKFGLYGTQFGSESRIDLTSWTLSGKKKQIIRTALNRSRKMGITIRENNRNKNTDEISEAWLKTRKCSINEIRFLVRPLKMNYRENERHFYAYYKDRAIGFIHFDPVYTNNKIISYVPNVSRASTEFPQGIFYSIMIHAIEVFKKENVPFLDLGLIPMSLDRKTENQESRILKSLLHIVYKHGNFLYNFKGLEFTKLRFCGEISKTYCCHSRCLPFLKFLVMFRLTGLF